jgi:hypothetical protein
METLDESNENMQTLNVCCSQPNKIAIRIADLEKQVTELQLVKTNTKTAVAEHTY